MGIMADSPICSRLPPHLVDALDADAAQQGLERSEVLRNLIEAYYFGGAVPQSADAGYLQARRIATRLAHTVLRNTLRDLPPDFDQAMAWLQQQSG